MSYVTNVVLSLGSGDTAGKRDKLETINRFFEGSGLIKLVPPSPDNESWFGGNKGFEANLFTGAFNYLDLNGFLTHLRSIEWFAPESVQLFVKMQDENFQLINVMKNKTNSSEVPTTD